MYFIKVKVLHKNEVSEEYINLDQVCRMYHVKSHESDPKIMTLSFTNGNTITCPAEEYDHIVSEMMSDGYNE